MSFDAAPLSKTAKYKKITKPLLERKRRARINRCLDELKDLMVGALEIDDDNLSKLEKADILEMTVNHLTKLHSPKDPVVEAKKFQAGFGQCAAEACRFIMAVPDLDEKVSQNLVTHLSRLITTQPLTIQVPERPHFSPPHSPSSINSDRNHYYSDNDRSSSDAEDSVYSQERAYSRNSYSSHGLLTTVDKVGPSYSCTKRPYLDRVPAEAKDAILKKIRQHIMDKRGNDMDDIQPEEDRKDVYRNELQYPYSVLNLPSDTLDLRKVRSPVKNSPVEIQHKSPELKAIPEYEIPVDYSNLPPKKKRKMLEYQELMRQKEANFKNEVAQENYAEGPSMEFVDPKWRPW